MAWDFASPLRYCRYQSARIQDLVPVVDDIRTLTERLQELLPPLVRQILNHALALLLFLLLPYRPFGVRAVVDAHNEDLQIRDDDAAGRAGLETESGADDRRETAQFGDEIGRASCRERV